MEIKEEISLSLPLLNLEELEMLRELRNSKEIAHLILNRSKNNSLKDIKEWLIKKNSSRKKEGIYIISELKVNFHFKPIGYITYFIEDELSKVAEIGLCLENEVRGKGYGKISLKLIIEKLRQDYGIRKFIFSALAENKASRKLFKSIGFIEIGIRKKHFYSLGEWHDVIIGEIIFD